MTDRSNNPAPRTSNDTQQPQPISSQEYLKRLRARRQQTLQPVTRNQTSTNPQKGVNTEESVKTATQPTTASSTTGFQARTGFRTEAKTEKEERFPGVPKPQPETNVYIWQAPNRPFKQRDRHYYITIGAIIFLISLILFFAGQFLPIAVVISAGFLAYVLSSVPPEVTTHKITTYGIRVDDTLYYWEELGRFWFDEKYGQPLFHAEVMKFPGRITLLVGEGDQQEIEDVLSEVLLKERPKDTVLDKAAHWIQEKIPLEVVK